MNALVVFTTFSIAAVLALIWWYTRLRMEDRMVAAVSRHASAMLSTRARLMDGGHQIPVALSLDTGRITYENADLDAFIDVRQIDEVEYSSDLMTGGIANGAVLRLRSHGRSFEFVMDAATAERWSHRLPPHRMDDGGDVHVQ